MSMITTVGEFFVALGGGVARGSGIKAAVAFETSQTVISNWKIEGRFPAWATARARKIAEANGFVVDPRLYETRPVRIDRSGAKKPFKRRTARH